MVGTGVRAARCGSGRAEQVFRAVAVVRSATRAAAVVHMIHGESNAAKTMLLQFQNSLREQGLDNDAGITALGSSARADRKPRFTRISRFTQVARDSRVGAKSPPHAVSRRCRCEPVKL